MVVKMRSIAIAAAVISGFAASENLVASCSSSVIAYAASGTFGSTPVSGTDKFRLAGLPFSITLYACESKTPTKTGSDYAIYSPILLTGTVQSGLLTTPYNIPPKTYTSIILVLQPPTLPDSIQLYGSVNVQGTTIKIHGNIALPAGTFTSTTIAPFSSVSIIPSKSFLTYSDSTASTTLVVIGTAAGTVYTPPAVKASPLLHNEGVRVITAHADGTQSVRPMRAAPIDLGASPDTVRLHFYASGVRDASEVHVQIAGQDVPVLYSGAAGYFPGLDEVAVELPRSLAGMGDVDVALTADVQTASPVRIHIQ